MKYLKYIKKYEYLNNHEYQIGDYVICKEIHPGNNDMDKQVSDFINNNIGQIVPNDNQSFHYMVQYKNKIPKDIKEEFEFSEKLKKCRGMSENEIIFNSKNKEEAEQFLTAQKYNLY